MQPQTILPRVIAVILLIVSLSMVVPVGFAVVALVHGAAIPPARWALPLTILAVGSVLTVLLSRRAFPLQLYLAAVSLWVIVAAYYWITAFQ